jgi:hypothetical protein
MARRIKLHALHFSGFPKNKKRPDRVDDQAAWKLVEPDGIEPTTS